jgi:hypothetical protein
MSPDLRQRLAHPRRGRVIHAREIRTTSALAEIRMLAMAAIAAGEGSAALFQIGELAADAERRSRYRLPCDVQLPVVGAPALTLPAGEPLFVLMGALAVREGLGLRFPGGADG